MPLSSRSRGHATESQVWLGLQPSVMCRSPSSWSAFDPASTQRRVDDADVARRGVSFVVGLLASWRLLRGFEFLGQIAQLALGHDAFDERKHVTLLQAYVRGQFGAELLQSGGGDGRCGGKRVRAMPDHGVVAEGAQHRRIVRVSVASVGRKQQFLLEPEVQASVTRPIGEKRFASFSRGCGGGAPELLGDYERLVMIAGENCECGRPLQSGDRSGIVTSWRGGELTRVLAG